MSGNGSSPLLEVEEIVVRYPVYRGLVGTVARRAKLAVHAVEGVSFTLRRGETLALVGESGCGKPTTAQAVLRLVEPLSGTIRFEGTDITGLGERGLRPLRRRIQVVYQDPYESLDPRYRVRAAVEEPLVIHRLGTRTERRARVTEALERVGLSPAELFLDRFPHELSGGQRQRVAIAAAIILEPYLLVADEPVSMLDVSVRAGVLELLETVGLTPAANYLAKYPHELSGGQRQRVAIARALAVEPSVIVADEPISMLDVSIRIGILNLMLDLKERDGLAFLYVTHDLASARYVADTVLVMYAGQIVEQGPVEQVLQDPLHPYTRLLLASVPDPSVAGRAPITVRKGLASAAVDPPEGCRFVERCPLRIGVCSELTPELVAARSAQSARCHVTAPASSVREEIHVESVQ